MSKTATMDVDQVMKPIKKTMTNKEMKAFLVGMLGQNIIYGIMGASLTYFYQFTLLIPAAAVSVLVAIARIWDAFNDPIMGTIVDKTRTRFGKCRPFLIAVPLPITILTILSFVNFGFYEKGGNAGMNALIVGWAGVMYILWGMAYTIGDIPLWGITALLTEDDVQRNKLMGWARIVGGIGGGVVLLAMQPAALAIGGLLLDKYGVRFAGSETAWQAVLVQAEQANEAFKTALAEGVDYNIAVKSIEAIPPVLGKATRYAERIGFLISTLFFAILGGCTFQVVGLMTKEKITASEKSYSLVENFKIMWNNKPFRKILISGILGSPKMLLMLAAMPLITYYFASKNPAHALIYMIVLGGGLFIGNLGIMGFAANLTKKYSKRKLQIVGNAIGILPYLGVYFMYLADPTGLTSWYWILLAFFLFFIAGVSMGITLVIQTFMVADCVDYEEYKNGIRPDGVFFSGQTFIAKLTSGIATLLSGIIYTAYGFTDSNVKMVNDYVAAGQIPREIPEFEPYMRALFVMVSIPPAIGSLLSIIPMITYPLTNEKSKEILDALIARRAKLDLEVHDDEVAEHRMISCFGTVIRLPYFGYTKKELENDHRFSMLFGNKIELDYPEEEEVADESQAEVSEAETSNEGENQALEAEKAENNVEKEE